MWTACSPARPGSDGRRYFKKKGRHQIFDNQHDLCYITYNDLSQSLHFILVQIGPMDSNFNPSRLLYRTR